MSYVEKQTRLRRHLLLTAEIKAQFKKQGSDESEDARAVVKFFSPYNGWRWYAFEYNEEDECFYGFVEGFEKEWGYFSLEELESQTFRGVPSIERDCHITILPTRAELNNKLENRW